MEERRLDIKEKQALVRRFFEMGYEVRDFDAAAATLAEDYVDHSPAGARGPQAAAGILRDVAAMFSDMRVEILDLFGEGDLVATRIRFTARHTGMCMGVPATGRTVSFEALENFRVTGGRIVESWGYWPDLAIREMLENGGGTDR